MDTFTLTLAFWDYYWPIINPLTWLVVCSVLAVYYLLTSRFGLTYFSLILAAAWYGLHAFVHLGQGQVQGPVIAVHLILFPPAFLLLFGCTTALMTAGIFIPNGPWLWTTLRQLNEKDRENDQADEAMQNASPLNQSIQQQADNDEREKMRAINQAAIAIQQARLAAGQKAESESAK